MGAERKTRRRLTLAQLAGLSLLIVVIGGGALAGACKAVLNCHLRGGGDVLEVTGGEIKLPSGFRAEPVASSLRQPTAFDFLPDGRILVAEREGLVRLVEDGRLAEEPVLDLSALVDTEFFRGLVAVSVDPEFDANGFIYVVYALRKAGREPKEPTVVRLSRFRLDGATAGAERVLLGRAGDDALSCTSLPSTADCLPADVDHIGADIAFAEDGTLFVATGDGGGEEAVEEAAFRAQDVEALGGKILRITRDGDGVAGNPFFSGDPKANRSKVWALGLRNPFRIALAPERDVPVVGDVGWRVADEIDVASAGANFGWPCYEGTAKTIMYRGTSACRAMYRSRPELVGPAIALLQPDAASVTGGAFYEGTSYPDRYRGAYFYADWGRSWIRSARIDPETGELDGRPTAFAEEAGGPVALRMGPDGSLYVLSLNHGQLRRIVYEGQ